MTRKHAEEIAAELFDGHPAAAALLVESQHAADVVRRRRSWLALLCLDPDRPLPHRWPENRALPWRETALEAPTNAVADLLALSFYGSRPELRKRAAELLREVCSKAAELVREAEQRREADARRSQQRRTV